MADGHPGALGLHVAKHVARGFPRKGERAQILLRPMEEHRARGRT